VQSINGPNVIISKLINNIDCYTPVKLFIQRLFSSKRHAFPGQKVINENGFIRLARELRLANDHLAFPRKYQTSPISNIIDQLVFITRNIYHHENNCFP
jgi:hypothetical protein